MKKDQETETLENEVDTTKRDFIKKFGTYAATAPLGMYMLMTPSASAHACSNTTKKCGCGSYSGGYSGGGGGTTSSFWSRILSWFNR